MALLICKQCGGNLSSTAKVCPHCGDKPKAKTSLLTLIIAGLFCSVVLMAVIGGTGHSPTSAPKLSPAETAAKAKENAAANTRTISAVAVMQQLKKSAREPESMVFERADTDDSGKLVCVEYRGRNGFGGMTKAFIVVNDGKASDTAANWNKHCKRATHAMLDSALFALKRIE